MAQELQVRVFRRRELCYTTTLEETFQLGRQRPGEPSPFHFQQERSRLIVAPIDDKLVSRDHLQLSIQPPSGPGTLSDLTDRGGTKSGLIEVRNLSKKRSVMLDVHGKLGPEKAVVVPAPFLVSFEEFAVRVESPATNLWEVRSLEHKTLAPGTYAQADVSRLAQQSILAVSARESHDSEKLIHWLSEMLGVLQSATGSSDFLSEAVDAVDKIVGLDSISAIRLEDGEWKVVATRDKRLNSSSSDSRSPSRTILQEITEKKRTIFQVPSRSAAAASLQGIKALVASPILDEESNVIGAIYGARYSNAEQQVPEISELEATMVEVLACSAAAGIAREKQQEKAIQARVQFEQFFTPQLARELESNPRMLDGQDAVISVLFCDIVGFSAISGRIGSKLTMQWISEVMDVLSEAVLNHDGVVVDYIGDELLAMWGAPKQTDAHALQACLSAQEMMLCKSRIDELWLERVGQPIDFRIGISSGQASVGNTGSTRRLKYGPLGNTVNLASRLQSAARQFGVRQLVSEETYRLLGQAAPEGLTFRPLGTAQFVNIAAPISVFEPIWDSAEPGQNSETKVSKEQLVETFASVISLLTEAKTAEATVLLEQLIENVPDDIPTAELLNRIRNGQTTPDCIWPLEHK